MVGRDAEWSGIIRAGAQMVSAVANSTVPKITIILGGSFGAGHYAMCGKAYDPWLILAWPNARYAVMGAQQAAETLLTLRIRDAERNGKKLDDAEIQDMVLDVGIDQEKQGPGRLIIGRNLPSRSKRH